MDWFDVPRFVPSRSVSIRASNQNAAESPGTDEERDHREQRGSAGGNQRSTPAAAQREVDDEDAGRELHGGRQPDQHPGWPPPPAPAVLTDDEIGEDDGDEEQADLAEAHLVADGQQPQHRAGEHAMGRGLPPSEPLEQRLERDVDHPGEHDDDGEAPQQLGEAERKGGERHREHGGERRVREGEQLRYGGQVLVDRAPDEDGDAGVTVDLEVDDAMLGRGHQQMRHEERERGDDDREDAKEWQRRQSREVAWP